METETKTIKVRTKRDQVALIRLLNGIDSRYKAEMVYCAGTPSRGVRHNLPYWAVDEARAQAYKHGAMVQVRYLEDHLRESYPER